MERTDRRLSGWGLILVAAFAMGAAGVYQFGWSSVRLPLGSRLGAPEPALGTVFTLFVVFQTIGQFPAGWVRDRFGPRLPLLVGAVCLAGGFVGVAVADSLRGALLAYAVGGVGVSTVYTVSINTAVKWFDERRGLATGLVAMPYSGLSFLLIPAIRRGVAGAFERTLIGLAVFTGVTALLAAAVLRDPPDVRDGDGNGTAAGEDDHTGDSSDAGPSDDQRPGEHDGADQETDEYGGADQETDEYGGADQGTDEHDGDDLDWTWREAIRTWQFWLLYGVFVVVNGVGLMVIGKVVSFASALSLSATAVTASASFLALADSGGVLVVSSISDRFGRRTTVAASLVLCGVSLAGSVAAGGAGLGAAFVALIGATGFFRSPPFAVFPSLIGDYYGQAHSSENYAALYTAKLFGGVFGGTGASALVVSFGWSRSFLLGAGLIALAGLALSRLRPVTASDRLVE